MSVEVGGMLIGEVGKVMKRRRGFYKRDWKVGYGDISIDTENVILKDVRFS